MSVKDSQALDLLDLLRGQDVDRKIAEFTAIKTQVKHQAVQPEAIAPLFEACRIGVQSANNALSAQALSCLGHLTRRVTIQEPSRIRHHVNNILPVLTEKLGDPKDRNRSVAMKAIQDLYEQCPTEVEKNIKELGFASKNPRARQESINWLAKTHASHPGFSIRSYTPILMQMLEDATEGVRETAKEVAVELFRNAPDHAKSDLKRELTKRQVRKGIATYIIGQLGLPGGSEIGSNAVGNGHHSDEPPNHKTTKSVAGSGGMSTAASSLASLPGTEMEQMNAVYVNTNRELEDLLQDMLPAFEGRESEHNWMAREQNVKKLRELARGNAPKDYQLTFQAGIKSLLDGILKSVNSLRTTVASNGCQLMKDLAIVMGPSLDPMIDIILNNIIKLCAGTKKITSQLGQIVVTVLLANVSYHPKLLNYIYGACTDKNVSPRSYAPGWIAVLLETHLPQKGHIEHTGGVDTIEKCIRKGLADPNPGVREAMRKTYWNFASIWPEKANLIIESLDGSHRKLLEKANPSGPSAIPSGTVRGAPSMSRAQTAPTRPSIRDAILAQKRQKSKVSSQAESSASVRSVSPVPLGPTGLSSAPVRRPGLKARPMTEKPSADIIPGYTRPASPAPSHPPRGTTPQVSRGGGTRSPPLSPQIGRFARGTTPGRSAGAHPAPMRKLNIMEQLSHPDWQIRVEGIVTVACVLARRTPPGYEGQKMPSLPPSDTFAPTLAKLFNDPQPEVVEHVVAPEVLAELAKVVPLEQIIPKVLLLAEGADEQHAQPITTSSLPALKRLMTESEAAELLFTIIKSMSTSGVVPRKLALGSFTTTQKRKIMNSALVWMNEIVESHARGNPNDYFYKDASYNSVVNRLVGMMGSKLANSTVLAGLLKNLEALDPQGFSKILDTFEPATRKELFKAWGQSVEETEPAIIEEKVANVEQVLGVLPQIDGASTTPHPAVLPSSLQVGANEEDLRDLPPLPKSPTSIVDLSASISSRIGENKPMIQVYQDPTANLHEPTTSMELSDKLLNVDTEQQHPKLRKQASASTLPKTQEGTIRLLETLVGRLHSRDMDTQAFRKLSNIIKNNSARGVLKEQNGTEIFDIWQGETIFQDLLSSLLGYLTAEDIPSARAEDLQAQGLLVLKNLISKAGPHFSRHEAPVFQTLLTMCGRFPEAAVIIWDIEDILEQFMAIANPQTAIDAILNFMQPPNNNPDQRRPQGSWCMALKCLADLIRTSQLATLEPQLNRLGQFAVRSMDSEEVRIRESCARMCTEMHSKVNDDQRLFDEILHGLKWGHTNLLTYYFTKREGETRQ